MKTKLFISTLSLVFVFALISCQQQKADKAYKEKQTIIPAQEAFTASSQEYVDERLNIYAPLSHRLGLYEIKAEMEDICLKHTNPYIYNQIKSKLQSSERERIQFINRFVQPIKEKLDDSKISYEISGRPKSIYSIWKKMQNKGVPVEEIYDIFAIRIIFKPKDTANENYEAMQIGTMITDIYREKYKVCKGQS